MRPDGYSALIVEGSSTADAGGQLASETKRRGHALLELASVCVAVGARCGVLQLPDETGLVLGTLFDRSGKRVDRVTAETVAGWTASRGRSLIEGYWGAYLAILCEPDGTVLVRDPSGLFPCYYRTRPGTIEVASDLLWLDLSGIDDRSICQAELHAQLQYASLRTSRTAIEGLNELLPGAAMAVRRTGRVVEQIWTPWQFARAWDGGMTVEDAADRLRRTIDLTIGAWTRLFARPLLSLSGGLDSSIVAAASARHARQIDAVTYRGGEGDLNEGRYAKLVADHLGIAWHDLPLDRSMVDLRSSAASVLPRPNARSFSQAADQQDLQLATALGSDAFLTGAGGDSLLWYFNTAAPALDRLRVDGVGAALQTVGDLADMCAVPWSRAFTLALRKLLQRRSRPWPHSVAFLSTAARVPALYPAHPWWPGPGNALPGVRAYVLALIQLSDHHEYHRRSALAPVLAPLASQPIVETCLGIPSWLSCSAGANRAVARAAFADALPPEILHRRTKGGFEGFVHDLLERNRALAREMLIEGQLAQGGWLDIEAIDHILQSPSPIGPTEAPRILRLVAIEAWLGSVRRR